MNRVEFMEQLEKLLIEIPGDEKEEAINFYSNYFEDAGEENEEKIIRELGSPERVARTIKSDLQAPGEYSKVGEYTEHGYKDADEIKDSIIKVEPSVSKTEGDTTKLMEDYISENNIQDLTQQGYHQNQGNQQGSYYQNQGNHQQGNYYHNQGNQQQGNYYQNQNNNQQGSYYQNQGNQQQNPYSNQGYPGYPQTTAKTNIPALILLCIFAVPFIFPMVIAGFATIFGLVVGFGAAGIACSAAGIMLLVTGITKMFAIPMLGVTAIGGGLICFGIGVLFIMLTVFIAKGFPLLCRTVAAIFRAPFGGKRVVA